MTEPDFKRMGDPLNDRLPPENLLNRRRRKDLARIVGPRTLDDENVCTRCGVPDVHCQCPADPVIAWVGPVAILHGERDDDSEMCLCGRPEYLTCPDWLAGNGTVSSLIFQVAPESAECTCPFRWTTHYRSCPLYVLDSDDGTHL